MKDNSRFGEVMYFCYRGGIAGQEAIDTAHETVPHRIVLGGGHVIPGIEDALCTMQVGEEKTVVIPPEEAYGRYQEDAVQTYPRSMVTFGNDIKAGDVIQWTNPASGMPIPVRVLECTPDAFVVDFNHPFAGETLQYWLKVVEKPVG